MLGNNFDGNLPRDIGNLSMLTEMLFGSNMLEGSLPPSIGNLSRLEVLDLSSNRLTGHILQEFGNLRALRVLILHSNSFTNDPSSQVLHFITSLTNCRELQTLNTGKNPLNGMLPNSVGNLSSSLTYFYVNDCKLNGNIPSEIGNLTSLIGLALTKNNFAGSVPSTMEGLRNIQLLDLSRNKLNGSIPPFLCLARSLAVLAADENHLRGSIPNCIGNLTSLRLLYLDYNALSSTIPLTLWSLKDLLQLTLSSNSLSGPLSLQVGGMKAAIVIDLSGNQLSGNIPSTIGSLKNLINISLSGNSFQGSIPESLGDLVGLELLNLSQNNLSGEIPKSLEDLRYLKYLNVSFNGLQGEIPSGGPFPNFTAQSFMGNKALCGPAWLQVPPCHRKSGQPSDTKSRLLRFILPAVASALLVVAFVFLLVRCPRRRRKTPIPEALPLTAIQRRVSFLELLRATNEFHESNLLGVGSFGSVYHGVLPDGLNIAVKIFNLQVQGGLRSFDTECEIMRNIRHRNLVKIICSCSNLDVKGLVLEYMPKGSLEKWLYSYNYFLDIIQRVNIMIDVASAIEYLHHGYSTPVVHCDLKPSNVLLDEDMVAHVCDFGIAKLLGASESVSQTKTLATIGYMAPEYGLDGLVSTRIDVYSFGIMLMEIFTRKRPTDEMFEGEMSLKRLVKESLPDSVIDIVDSNLLNRGDGHSLNKEHCVTSIMELALQCTKESPEERINMVEILARLKNIKGEFLTERERRRH
ncbi:probable LRR receptor-like serine/threonine-protein kinase At3g47570 [Populus nigra]|uniref:probable LRR receptor-like serine/threonine-protein kinase At3g47570 n=1 Tax=Populus nigra TaxID=3691 RepID=UPI002B279483|nr:probable LRR receptor-like serine/threonine-protein kinase At3g47570 [Populus nigra]